MYDNRRTCEEGEVDQNLEGLLIALNIYAIISAFRKWVISEGIWNNLRI